MKIGIIADKKHNQRCLTLLSDSARKRGLDLEPIYTDEFMFGASTRGEYGALYRTSIDEQGRTIEKLLVNDSTATLYTNNNTIFTKPDNVLSEPILHEHAGIPIIPSVFGYKDKQELEEIVDQLGGFPVILKAAGGTKGVGVMRVDSFESLISIVDFLTANDTIFIIRKYIDYEKHVRIIVLNGASIGHVEYRRLKSDFRSNAAEKLDIATTDIDDQTIRVAVDSVATMGFEFGGVDILIDSHGTNYLAEVNMPCYFPRVQDATGIDISGMMLDYLKSKVA